MSLLFSRRRLAAVLGLACHLAAIVAVCLVPGPARADASDSPPHEAPPPGEPLVINGCPIWPYTRCLGVDLRHAYLVGKNLTGADLRGANLTRTDLRGANLSVANLEGANLTGTRLNKATASNANFTRARFSGADLEAARMMRSDFSGAEFNGCNMEIMRLDHAWFVGTRFVGNDLQEAKFNQVNLQDAYFEANVTLYAIFPSSNMVGCKGCQEGWQ